MKKILMLLALCPLFAQATNYYISSSGGNNSDSGTSASHPWKTIVYLNTHTLHSGDSVFLKSGDVFTETLNLNYSGTPTGHIVYSTYGGTARAMISGFYTLTGGTQITGTNIYKFYCPNLTQQTNMLVMDGIPQPMGRWPDAGYRTYDSISSTTITDVNLPSSPNWTGAYLVAHDEYYVIDTARITSQSGHVITVNLPFPFTNISRGNGYFIENDPRTLQMTSVPGRWYNDYTKDSMQVYLPGGLAGHVLQVPTLDRLCWCDHKSNIDVYNMDFEGSNLYTVLGNFDTAFTMTNCLYRYGAGNCFLLNESPHTSLVNDTLDYFQNNGAFVTGNSSTYCLAKNIQVNNCGLIPGMGQRRGGNGTQSYTAWDWPFGFSTFQNMTILNSGYIGLYFAGDSVTIKNCVVDTFCVTKIDGGGFYTTDLSFIGYTHGRSLTNCIALHGQNLSSGVPPDPTDASFGFYFDSHSQSVVLTNCTGAYNASAGLFIHGAKITSNGCNYYGNGWAQQFLSEPSTGQVFQLTLKKNRLASSAPGQLLSAIVAPAADLANLGTIDTNYYAKTDTSAFYINTGSAKTVSFPTWQRLTTYDPNGVFRNVCTTFVYNTSSSTATKTLQLNDLAGNANNSSVSVAAFSSLILYFVSP
ncbi:hypothetical protein Q4E93_02185 [Flavitalea sp. BT771]|uniref:hypothetical protein n=1 Tax=Flavitalea sp. BT771 TaxID=3063329 RepID=UPI0026E1DC94|nr:hypothetical protein [Flavitalea sp. BT771]MDO6429379.1 hypothetical protein [Flavitalea sp. BT771]MDV6218493.1 hypothetical protein [Flavitalea sp. BT771]